MSNARYSIIPTAAVRDRELTEMQFRCLCLIGTYLGEDRSAYPSQTTLADAIGVTRESVNRAIKVLVKKGYVRAQTRYRNDGGQTSSLYEVILDQPDRQCDLGITPPVITEDHTPRDRIGSHQEDTQDKIPRLTNTSEKVFGKIWEITPKASRARSSTKLLKASLEKILRDVEGEVLFKAWKAFLDEPTSQKEDYAFVPGVHRWFTQGRWEAYAGGGEPDLLRRKDDLIHGLTWTSWAAGVDWYIETGGGWDLGGFSPAPHERGTLVPADLIARAKPVIDKIRAVTGGVS